MRLKRIEMQGFKSFADRVVIDFDSPIVVIVGPNGCGKSNIVDAFKWVMGEQRAKSLRGDRMLDVIFSGTLRKKALNFAEVMVVFSDVEGELPTEYDEVEVCRRVYRNGDSEYTINRRPCRLKDIQSLFWDTGLGKDAYAIFEQGRIDDVIQMSPRERRGIFEDAAGILRFKLRKKEMLDKLSGLDGNLDRIKEVHRETAKTLRQLERQSEHAQQFKQQKDEYQFLTKAVLAERWRFANSQEKALGQQIEEKRRLQEELKASIQKEDQQFQGWLESYREKKAKLKSYETDLQKVVHKQQIHRVELNGLQKKLEDSHLRLHSLQEEVERIANGRSASREEFKEKHIAFESVSREVSKAQEEAQQAIAAAEALKEELEQERKVQHSLQKKHLEALQREADLQRQSQKEAFQSESDQSAKKKSTEELLALQEMLDKSSAELAEKQSLWHKLAGEIDSMRQRLQTLDQSLQAKREERQSASESLTQLVQRLSEYKGRYAALKRLKESLEGASFATKSLLAASADANSPLFGKIHPLYEKLQAEKGYEKALAGLLRNYTQSLVVETKADKSLLLQYAREEDLKDFSFICLEELPKNKDPVAEESFAHFVSRSPLADHFTAHYQWQEVNHGPFVNQEGFVRDALSVYHFPLGDCENHFLREAEMQELQAEIAHATDREQQIREQLEAFKLSEADLKKQRLDLDKEVRQKEMKSVEANFSLQKIKSERKEAQDKIERLQSQIESLDKRMAERNALFAQLEKEYSEAQLQTQEAKKALFAIEEKVEALSAENQQKQLQAKGKEQALTEKQQKAHDLRRFIDVFEVRDHEQERAQLAKQKEKESLSKEVLELARCIEEKQLENQNYEEEVRELQERKAQHLRIVQLESEQELVFSKKKKQLGEQVTQGESKIHALEKQVVEFATRAGSLAEELQSRCGLSVEEVQDISLEGISPEDAEERLQELQKLMSKAGAVNMTAIEEFERIKEKNFFIEEELDDLVKAKEELLQITNELDKQSRKMFRDTFKQVRAHFQHNFSVLFGGGEADLTLVESGDVLQAGIEITAKPPGKAMRSIQLLSGGEKCLTALALLFAIFSVRPAPFCILDEIDAPLDDANTQRFTELLKEYKDETQFIVVTHNKYTMTIADKLCGVSMEQKGISKVMSMQLTTNDQELQPSLQLS